MKIFFDGGCRPNPGEMEVAVVASGRVYRQRAPGLGSSHQAEWLALLYALEVARTLALRNVVLLGDSAAVINQANGRAKARDEATASYVARFREEARLFDAVRVRHVRRTQNLAGIALAQQPLRSGPEGLTAERSSGSQ